MAVLTLKVIISLNFKIVEKMLCMRPLRDNGIYHYHMDDCNANLCMLTNNQSEKQAGKTKFSLNVGRGPQLEALGSSPSYPCLNLSCIVTLEVVIVN